MLTSDQVQIVIVDDDSDDIDIFVAATRDVDPDINCISFQDCKEFIEYIKTCSTLPNYIFLDINLPKMTGLECLEELKKHPGIKQIPVIIYSTAAMIDEKEKAQRLGAFSYIVKPADFNDLKVYLKHLLAGKKIWLY